MKAFIYTSSLIAAFLLTFSCPAFGQIITTVAGSDSIALGDGGPAIDARLNQPTDVALDGSKNIYITDRNNDRIRKVDASGIITTIAGIGSMGFSGDNEPATAAKLNAPYGIALDDSGNIYFSEDGNQRIRKISTSGIITTIAGDGTNGYNGDNIPATQAQLYDPGGVAVDGAGNVYIADFQNHRVRKINTSGIITTVAGIGTPGYSGDNGQATSAELNLPEFIAFDNTGNLFIAEYGNYCIRKVNNSGIITTIAGNGSPGFSGDNGTATSCQLNHPTGVKIDINGNVYISDAYNYRIRKVNPSGIINTYAGNGLAGFSGDNGPAISAEIGSTDGLALDGSGNLYIADIANNRIRYIRNTVSVNTINNTVPTISLYPNPCHGTFTFNIYSGIVESAQIIITNAIGQKVSEFTATTNIPISVKLDERSGLYFIAVTTATCTQNARLVVAR